MLQILVLLQWGRAPTVPMHSASIAHLPKKVIPGQLINDLGLGSQQLFLKHMEMIAPHPRVWILAQSSIFMPSPRFPDSLLRTIT